jgi:hypothetical protein
VKAESGYETYITNSRTPIETALHGTPPTPWDIANNPDDFDCDFGLEMGRYEEDWYFAGTGNLDECNGAYDVNGDYGYYITDKYPFTPPCTFGARDPSFGKQSPTLPQQVAVDYSSGWNMVGLPLEVGDSYYQTLFPSAPTNAMYSFDGSYSPEDYLVVGTGYLIRLLDGGVIGFYGATIYELTISLTEGWNLISGISTPLSVDVLYNSGLVVSNGIYAFDGSYYNTSTIDPGMGYWVRALADGDVTLSSSSSMGRTEPIVNRFPGANTLELSNGTHSSTLYFGKDVPEGEELSYSLPPTFPQMAFDVRFNGDMKYAIESGNIEVLNTSDNLTISYDIIIDAGEHMNWVLTSESGNEYTLEGFGEITVPTEDTFTLERKGILPIAYTLHQNYPNPFNPITSLRYDLPEQARVTLTIYDLMGREITQLVNTTQEAGFRSVKWNATDSFGKPVSAGVYLYQIRTDGFVQTKKMVLLK